MRWLKLGVAAVPAIAAVALGYVTLRNVPWRHSSHERVGATEPSVPTSGLYALDFKTTVAQTGGPPFLSVALGGPILFSRGSSQDSLVLRVDFFGSVVHLAGVDDAKTGAGKASTPIGTLLSNAFRAPFFLEYSKDGDFTGVRMTAKGPPFATRLWQSLGTALQYRSGGRSAVWEMSEADTIGRYAASYRWLDGETVEKKKQRYTSFNASGVQYADPESTERFLFTEEGALKLLVLKERIESKASGPIPGFGSLTDIRLAFSEDQSLLRSLDLKNLSFADYALIPPGYQESNSPESELDLKKIGGRTIP